MKFRILLYSILLGIVLLVACGDDNSTNNPASAPVITGMTPGTVNAGQQNVAGTITGANFTGSITVNMGEGITVSQAAAASSNQIIVVFSVSSTTTSGARTITVTAAGGTGSSTSVFSVKSSPIANFTATPNEDIVGQYTFDASDSNGSGKKIDKFAWDFGDGTKDEGKKIVHQFIQDGTYRVELKVRNANGTDTMSNSFTVKFPNNCGFKENCLGFDHPQYFTIVGVNGPEDAATIVSDRDLFKCSSLCCGEIRRANVPPESPDEFLGDVEPGTLTCRSMKLKVYGLPFYHGPKVGERVYLVYKKG